MGGDPWVGVVSGTGMLVICGLMSNVVNFSFSYNTYFLSSLGFMAAQYTVTFWCLVCLNQGIDFINFCLKQGFFSLAILY